MKRFLVTLLTIGLFACGEDSPVSRIAEGGLKYSNEGSLSDPVKLIPGAVSVAHVGEGTSYYYPTVSPNTTYTVTVILQAVDNVVLRIHKGGFSSPPDCTSDTGGTKEECSVTLSALETSIFIEVINSQTVFGTSFTIQVH